MKPTLTAHETWQLRAFGHLISLKGMTIAQREAAIYAIIHALDPFQRYDAYNGAHQPGGRHVKQ